MKPAARRAVLALLMVSGLAYAGPGAAPINYECGQLAKADEDLRCKVVVFGDGSPTQLRFFTKPVSLLDPERKERLFYLSNKLLAEFQSYGGWMVERRQRMPEGKLVTQTCRASRHSLGAVICDPWQDAPALAQGDGWIDLDPDAKPDASNWWSDLFK
jgi:hypothetical protein